MQVHVLVNVLVFHAFYVKDAHYNYHSLRDDFSLFCCCLPPQKLHTNNLIFGFSVQGSQNAIFYINMWNESLIFD